MRAALLALVLGAAILPGCSSDDPETEVGDAGADASGATWGGSACASCVEATCAQQITNCSSDPGCAARLTCLRKCPLGDNGDVDAACAAGCPVGNSSSAQAAASALDDCRGSAGCSQCGDSPDAGDAGCRDPFLCQQCPAATDPNPCFQCELSQCCQSYDSCKSEPACDAFAQCMKGCTQTSYDQCVAQCDIQAPGGYDKWAERLACLTMSCVRECDGPNPCIECTGQKCASEYLACQLDEACSRASLCTAKCNGSAACIQTCTDPYPGSYDRLVALGECVNVQCVDQCDG